MSATLPLHCSLAALTPDHNDVPGIKQSQAQHLLDGDLAYYPSAFTAVQANRIYQLLRQEIHWQQEEICIYGKTHLIPRMQCWIGDPHCSYRYSGKTFFPFPWPTTCQQLLNRVNEISDVKFNSVLANWYRSGMDHMGWHSDDEPELGSEAVIASLSFGDCRDFALRRVGETRQHTKIPLNNGSLLLMKAGMQQRWQHALPQRKKQSLARINLTFRKIIA